MSVEVFVDPWAPRRTSMSLYSQLRDAIASGRLQQGDRLPTSRELAAELGVARSTVAAVYGRLVAEGALAGRVGDGTFVAGPGLHTGAGTGAGTGTGAGSGSGTRGRRQGVRPFPAAKAVRVRRPVPRLAPPVPVGPSVIDLRTGRPDPRHFPLTDWRRCVASALTTSPPGYGEAAGLAHLRSVLAAWIGRSRGVEASAEQVLVTAGAQQAFDLLSRVLLTPGDVIAVEDPGYPAARLAFEANGLRVAGVPVDGEGIVVSAIPQSAKAVCVTPSHQAPTGVTMSIARRHALITFARRRGAVVIEDDYDSEYRYVDRPLEPLHRLDRDGHVVYVGTFSKTLSPSLRLGFVVGPEDVIEELAHARRLVDAQPPHVLQAALAELIARGLLDRHLRRTKRLLAPRHALVSARLAELHERGLTAVPPRSIAGLHSMLELPSHVRSSAVAERLRVGGVAIEPIDGWRISASRSGLLVGFGQADLRELDAAFAAITGELTAGELTGIGPPTRGRTIARVRIDPSTRHGA